MQLAAAALALGAAGQEPIGPAPPAPKQRVLLDRVLGVIGDKAILESSIRGEIESRIAGYRASHQGADPPREEVERLQRDLLLSLNQTEAMAQAARTMRGTTPQNVDRLFEEISEEFQRERVERAGSLNKYQQELGLLGKTWDSVREEKRTETLVLLAEQQNLANRYRDQLALMVSPQEMLRYYRENVGLFVDVASADLEVMAFSTAGDAQAASARAQEAAAVWRAEALSAQELAARFGARVLEPQTGVRNDDDDPRAPEIKAFAGAAQEGDVSAPLPRGDYLWILRCVRRRDARHDRFEDPEVRARLLDMLAAARRHQLRIELLLKSEKTHRFVPVPRRR